MLRSRSATDARGEHRHFAGFEPESFRQRICIFQKRIGRKISGLRTVLRGCASVPTVPGINFPIPHRRAYLASRSDPSLKIGEAANAGYWNFDHQAWQPLKQFLQAM